MYLLTHINKDGSYSVKDTVADATKHFTLEEFYANSYTAKKNNIDNTPGITEKNEIIKLITTVLEPIRKEYGKPM